MKKLLRIMLAMLVLLPSLLAAFSAYSVHRIESSLPPVGRFIEVDGVRLHYTDQGTGPAIVLVHGASSNLLEFQRSLVPHLAERHRVIVFDRPGHGYSERGDGEWPDPATIARMLLDASEALGAPRPVVLGHSWAGSVVMSALVREPERIAGGVLLAGAAGHWVGEPGIGEKLSAWPGLLEAFAHTLLYPLGSQLVPEALASVFAPHSVPPDHAARIGAELALRPGSYMHNVEDMQRLSEFLQLESTRYRGIERPLLVIHGSRDELVPFWNHGQRLERVVDSLEVALLEGHGHALHHVDGERVASLVRDFARRALSKSE